MDPFLLLRAELHESMATLQSNLASLKSPPIMSNNNNTWHSLYEETQRLYQRCCGDVTSLDKAVEVMRRSPEKYKLSPDEVEYRGQFVLGSKKNLTEIKNGLEAIAKRTTWATSSSSSSSSSSGPTAVKSIMKQNASNISAADTSRSTTFTDGARVNNEFLRDELQRQSEIQHTQEAQVEDMTHGIRRVKFMAESINVALEEDTEALKHLDTEMDSLSNRLSAMNKRMDTFLRSSSLKKKLIFLVVLILMLIILMVLVFTL